MKDHADDENEVHDVRTFVDGLPNVITPVVQWPSEIALSITSALIGIVRRGHGNPVASRPNEDGITRAQVFEEGDVYMLEAPFDGYHADRYLMDFYNVKDKGICSRMHLHTGLRFVRMMTGPETVIRVSSLSPFRVAGVAGVHGFPLDLWEDDLPDTPEGFQRTRFNALVPPCSWVDMQIPRGTSHQFNATGPHAVIDSVHPEESIEVFREAMSDYKMMAQTMFLAEDHPDADSCAVEPETGAPRLVVVEEVDQSLACLGCGVEQGGRHDPDCPVYQRRRAMGLER
jgi:hypothetical protein